MSQSQIFALLLEYEIGVWIRCSNCRRLNVMMMMIIIIIINILSNVWQVFQLPESVSPTSWILDTHYAFLEQRSQI